MRTFIQLVFTGLIIAVVGWYITYRNNPATLCKEHPDKSKAEEYVYCWPGFDKPKGSFIDGDSPVNDNIKKFKVRRRN